MAFTEVSTVRKISGVSQEDYEDSDLQDFIALAQKEVTAQIQSRVLKEKVEYIDRLRSNKIDGENKKFYLRKVENFLGDRDYDGDVNEKDVLVYLLQKDGSEWLETLIQPISVDHSNLSFTLSEAPETGTEIYVTYCYSPYDLKEPDPMVSMATAYLTASYLMVTENGDDDGRSIRIGNLSIGAGKGGMPGNSFYTKFMEIMTRLIESTDGGVSWGESFVKI
jgi:hypothetical protein